MSVVLILLGVSGIAEGGGEGLMCDNTLGAPNKGGPPNCSFGSLALLLSLYVEVCGGPTMSRSSLAQTSSYTPAWSYS